MQEDTMAELYAKLSGHDAHEGALMLLQSMQARADRVSSYAPDLQAWLETGSTLNLRRAVVPFGDYWDSTAFSRNVDLLDEIVGAQLAPVAEPEESEELSF